MRLGRTPLLAVVLALGAPACGSDDDPEPLPVSGGEGPAPFDPGQVYEPDVTAAGLAVEVTNPLFPAPVGAAWVYEADTDEGLERIDITVEAATHDVWGTTARVVRDTVLLDGEMVEDTRDWYAQDAAGNVWYLGEDTYEYENGQVICACGAWTAGEDGALPGVVMLGQPAVGDVYRQEYLVGEAEDVAEVVSTTASVTVPAGSFSGCLETRDRSAIDPELDEYKYYCPGVGLVLVEEDDVRVELIEYSGPE
jgi:hypothetical protein